MEDVIEKYSNSLYKNFDKDNMIKIIDFLIDMGCFYVDSLLEDYLDLFIIEYDNFVCKYNELNLKYDNNFLEFVADDMNLLEEFFDE